VDILKHPRYVDTDKCIACGICAEKCPKKVDDLFNEGLIKRKSIYVEYAQAVPLKYAIDADSCIYFKKGKCKACEKFCPAGAINFDEKEEKLTLNIGSIILAPGFEAFDPSQFEAYQYASHPNVVTSMEFERILSATGPFQGHLERPSDRREPQKIAFLQCVGSRDINRCDHSYCSSVCCMYAIKEAVIAKEHAGDKLDTAVFFMDMRTPGKNFDSYYNRAREEVGVRFVRSRVHSVVPAGHGSEDLRIFYVDETGQQHSEKFSMVVLSTGMKISQNVRDLAQRLDIELDADGFTISSCFSPVATSRPGVFACGAFSGPKDIPQSVMEASAASSASAALLAGSRNTLTRQKTYPPEDPVIHEEPRIGVFVCHCGINIGGVVDVPAVREYAETLPHVVYAADNLFTCSQDTQEIIRDAAKENRLNRVVVAACTPRTHEPLFQETIREAGLNPYLFEFANIRDQDSWVHQNNPEKATQKAKDLVRMAVSKAAFLEPIERMRLDIDQKALVIGGGIAGMNAALNLADQGYHTYLVEKTDAVGGQGLSIKKTWKGEDVPGYLKDLCERINGHDKVELLVNTEISDVKGFIGNFRTTVLSQGSNERELTHGVIILATGGTHLVPDEYLYGRSERVTLWHELEDLFGTRPEILEQTEGVAFVQCVGSREPDRPYCSKVCCTSSIQQAIDLKTRKPNMDVTILYRDIRTYGQHENLYRKARELGVLFIRFTLDEKPVVEKAVIDGKDKLKITVKDHVLGVPVRFYVDYLNLATAIIPEGQEALAKMLKVPLSEDGFFLEAHMKLRPVDFATDGVFVCGLAHYPKPIEESIAQAQAAAARAASILAKESVEMEPIVSMVDQDKCIGCGLCEASCPFGAIHLIKVSGRGYKAENIQALCKGCGVCAAACPQHAIDMKHFRDQQILAAVEAGGAKG
jgi:heterodisulfide reductase subunit A